jgi:Fe-S protein assembly chaperone HscA
MPKVVGIDLGTTNSLVAAVIDGRPTVLRDAAGRGIVPSVVGGRADGSVVVGSEARETAQQFPEETIFSVKRFMGRDRAEVADLLARLPYRTMEGTGQIRFKVGAQWMTPPQISAEVLRALKRQAEEALGAVVEQAVITVPAYFNDGQRQATRDAGKLAGLEVLRIINEPTAACLAYGLQEKQEGIFAVYDLGGGTFDVSILRVEQGVFEVLATNGDTELGGDDLDRLIGEKFLAEAEAGRAPLPRKPELLATLRHVAEQAKIALTDEEETHVRLDGCEQLLLERKLTRAELETWIRPLIARTLEPCRRALEDADLLPEEIDEVVLVGGSTRMPLVRRMVAEYFECQPHCELNPDEVVALGAAIQADILAGNRRDLLLLDVTPLSLGIETYGGAVSRIIPRNSTVPCSVNELYTTFVDNQTHVDIHVVQGEHELAARNRSLARFKLGPIPALPAGFARIEVTFTLDADGILRVSARDQRTGASQAIEVKPTYGMTEQELEAMLKASADQSAEEKEARLLIEERNHAEMTLRATEKALREAGDLLDELDLIVVEEQLARLREAMKGSDYRALRAARDRLEGAAQPLAAAAMNAALARGLRGRKASEVLGPDAAPTLTPAQVNPDHQKAVPVQIQLGTPRSGGGQ